MDDESSTPNTPEPHDEAETVILGALVSSRAEQAYEMKLSGKTLSAIADELGYRSTIEVAQALSSQMKQDAEYMTESGRMGILQMENDRLDRLLEKCWPSAMLNDFRSIESVLHIMDRRIKINRLDAVDTATQQHTVLVVGGSEQDYVNRLKELGNE